MWQSMQVARGPAPATRGVTSVVHRLVAALAGLGVVLHGGVAAGHVVRVVARQAGHLTALEACRLRQPICGPGDLELVGQPIVRGRGRRMIEVDERVAERRSRHIRLRRPANATELERQRTAGRLEVALQADLELPVTAERARIHDGAPAAVHIARAHRLDMPLPGAMTALAIDAFGQRGRKRRTGPVVANGIPRIAVVARHTAVVDDATEVEVGRPVVAGTHRPLPAPFGVPAQRQLHQPAVGRAAHERPRVVAGTNHVVGSGLEDVHLGSAGPELVAALHQRPVALRDRVVTIRRGVVEAPSRDSRQRSTGPGRDLGERSGHAGQRIRTRDPAMAAGTRRRIGIAVAAAVGAFAWWR